MDRKIVPIRREPKGDKVNSIKRCNRPGSLNYTKSWGMCGDSQGGEKKDSTVLQGLFLRS